MATERAGGVLDSVSRGASWIGKTVQAGARLVREHDIFETADPRNLLKSFGEIAQRRGPVARVNLMGVPLYLVTGAEAVGHVLKASSEVTRS